MRLQLLPARTGATWVASGLRTFAKQPLALAGLFFMAMAAMSVLGMFPFLGVPMAVALLPAMTLGMMAASLQAHGGRFPMPTMLLTGFRNGPAKTRALLVLGGMYALGFVSIVGVSYLVDGGAFASLYLGGETPSVELMQSTSFQGAMWVFLGLHLPLSLMFWHAPALVFWQDVPPLKSMFFSLVACLRNFLAYLVFSVLWVGVMVLAMLLITTLSSLLGQPQLIGALMFPVLLLVASMFFSSLVFTYQSSFDVGADPAV